MPVEQSEESGLNWGPSCGPDDISDPCLQKGRGCPPSTSHARGPALVVSSLSPVGGPPGWVSWGTGSAGPLACLASASLSVSLPPAQNCCGYQLPFVLIYPAPFSLFTPFSERSSRSPPLTPNTSLSSRSTGPPARGASPPGKPHAPQTQQSQAGLPSCPPAAFWAPSLPIPVSGRDTHLIGTPVNVRVSDGVL